MPMLSPGKVLWSADGQRVTVGDLIGEGGQAEVYRASADGQAYALKWYHVPSTPFQHRWATEQYRSLSEYLLPSAPPDPRFVWPLALVDDPNQRTFGYLMELLSPNYMGLESLVLGQMRPVPTFAALCRSAIALAECFRKLHNMGACYKDINLGGPALDPRTGEVRICDTDNVRINRTPGNIIFIFFAAPELIRGEGVCQTNTDIHSLAVLLFYMFIRHHPLAGARELRVNVFGEVAQRKFYGREPVFIYDPHDDSNRPMPGFHDPAIRNWAIYPGFLQELFTRAFTDGLHYPTRRVREGEWMAAFSRLRDGLFYCSSCGGENFLDFDTLTDAPSGTRVACWRCHGSSSLPLVLEVGDFQVLLNHDTVLSGHHLGRQLDVHTPMMRVSQHPRNPSRWGLTNLTDSDWVYRVGSGDERLAEPGRSVPLRAGLVIELEGVETRIRRL